MTEEEGPSPVPASLFAERAMRVAVDAVAVQSGGGLTFLLGQLPFLESCAELTVYVNSQIAPQLRRELPGSKVRISPRWSRPLPLRLLWENFVLPREIKGHDVLYAVGNLAAFATRKPQVVVVQSAYMFGPDGARAVAHTGPSVPFRVKIALQRLFGQVALRRATVLIATSQFMAAQVRRTTRRDVDLRVVPIAGLPLGHSFRVIDEPLPTERPFALSIGSDLPNKDRLGLVRSWPQGGDLDLVLVGTSHSRRLRLPLAREVAARHDVHWLGSITDRARLAQLYAGASLVVAHSHLEGFGMTTLEAMASETPVVAADIPAHREVCRDAAVYYDPRDADGLASAVCALFGDDERQKALIEAGRARVVRFSWEQNAKATCAILRDACGRQEA